MPEIRIVEFKKLNGLQKARVASMYKRLLETERFPTEYSASFRVAVEGETPVGFTDVQKDSKGHYCSTIYVEEEHRGKGIGKQLLSYAIQTSKKGKTDLRIIHPRKDTKPFFIKTAKQVIPQRKVLESEGNLLIKRRAYRKK